MTPKYRASQSFTAGEIIILDYICRKLLQSDPPDIQTVQRHPEFPSVAQKVIRMRQRLDASKKETTP